jgi:hypothetical protein
MITLKQLKSKLEKDFGWENLESDDNKWFVDNLLKDTIQAIEVIRCSTQLPTEDEILSESNSRQLEGAEPYSFAGGARWALSNIKQIPKTQKED